MLHAGRILLTNIKLGWKSLTGANTLALKKHLPITVVKSFITLGQGSHTGAGNRPGELAIKFFFFVTDEEAKKLERLSFFCLV
jgi:hypothetical protein